MKKIQKLEISDFNTFEYRTSNLKSFCGGGTPTKFKGGSKNGPDTIDPCSEVTTYADGTTSGTGTNAGGDVIH